VNRADDLGALAQLFTEHWDKAEGKCDVGLDDIARAEELGAEILEALSPSAVKEINAARDLRRRAAEYLRRGIDSIRDVASYAFRNSPRQMDRYPSLYVNRGNRKPNSKNDQAESSESEPEATTTPPESSEPSVPELVGPDEVTEPYIATL
jgi:hypothetical protein